LQGKEQGSESERDEREGGVQVPSGGLLGHKAANRRWHGSELKP
jgi:hypothetical protein